MNGYDVIIIGSGMGGLVCGDILSREGYSVCIIEKNKQIGGCLQIYARDKVVFDSGVHYVGGLDKGQNLYQLFKYLGLMDKLKLERMDENAFDKIIISGDEKEYALAQGYENFIATLVQDFPEEATAIRAYCDKIKDICKKFPLYNLDTRDGYEEKTSILDIDTKGFIESLTGNNKLQAVLAGNNELYAGVGNETPFYVHALITNSYIESSWKCVDGGSQIAKYMAKNIRTNGGTIFRNTKAVSIVEDKGKVDHVILEDGSKLYAEHFISNLHPVKTLQLTETTVFKQAYKNRMHSLKDTISCFIVNIVLKKDSYKYHTHNYYWHREGHLWSQTAYTEQDWPLGYAIFISATSRSKEYAEGFTIFTYMRYEEVKEWENTFNTVSAESSRGESYEAFKKRKAEKLIDVVSEKFPMLRSCIKSYYTSTPLSFRDYIGTDNGSLYGIAKDYKEPLKTFISPRTKLPNLYFTGQNLNLHGVLGAAISGLVTCTAVMNSNEFIKKIKNA
ncbi:NAD(P)/FAD-dependent oxidoreductase [Panacibacter ginsenosidivorans]|uniref:NAD(P)/FAD-dependent oxidoreductase n=1 Tax=Panacibacter ginsenosidivorans TaxID=1813871 RepID=A0A5B8VEN6_9BACT|nr:NAD(P)-binding protein [Panacibacter ginsenosidivorans]QEC69759.1 NAD(P)/FAD-dependent oxidoreductase [Panacibacter ginsenosidivorans]